MATVSSPLTAATVGPRLLEYLESRFDVGPLRFAEAPTFIEEGWETYICRFRVANGLALPKPFTAPLVLRVYANGHGWPRLAHEYAAKEQLRGLDYPVPRPLLLERDDGWFGGPFMIMESVPGRSMLTYMYDWFPAIFYAPAQMAKMHARLHRLPAAGFPHEAGPFLQRRLSALEDLLAQYELTGLAAGLRWLKRHRPASSEWPSILHLDFHPANLLVENGHCTSVVDWCDSDVGDRHADVAVSLLLIESTPLKRLSPLQRFVTPLGRLMLRRRYLRAYKSLLPVDQYQLRYYRAWASLQRLARWATWLRDSPLVFGSKASALTHVTPSAIRFLERYFHRQAGVTITLDPSLHNRAALPLRP